MFAMQISYLRLISETTAMPIETFWVLIAIGK